MNHVSAWDRLLTSLRSWADVREVSEGLEVSFTNGVGARRIVEIVMTPSDWDELSEVVGRESPASVKSRLLTLEKDQPYLLCDSGVELIASSTRDLPPDEFADVLPEPGGYWFFTDRAGNEVRLFPRGHDDR